MMMRSGLDLVIVFGCLLLVIAGCAVGVVLDGGSGLIEVFSVLGNLLAASGGILAGVAAICAIRLWRCQITLPRELDVLDAMAAANYEVRHALSVAVDDAFKYSLALEEKKADSITSSIFRRSIHISDIRFYSESVSVASSKMQSSRKLLESSIQKYSILHDKAVAYGIAGLVTGQALEDDCAKIYYLAKYDIHEFDVSNVNAAFEKAMVKINSVFDSVRSGIVRNYKAG